MSCRGYDASLVGHENWSYRFGRPETAKLLYWYSQRQKIKEICECTALKPRAVRKACDVIREKLAKHIVRLQMEDSELLGRGNTRVLVDCTYVTKKKNHRFQGRTTDGHTTCIVGMWELDLETRKGTGRVILKVCQGELKYVMKELIPKYCVPGAHIVTDEHGSYKWLHEGHVEKGRLSQISGFIHSWVKHSAGEFADEDMSTNGVEALLARTKRHFKCIRCTKVSHRNYGPYLAEFLWREKFLSGRALGGADWRKHAFWLLCDALSSVTSRRLSQQVGPERMPVDKDLAKQFQKLRPKPAEPTPSQVAAAAAPATPQGNAIAAKQQWLLRRSPPKEVVDLDLDEGLMETTDSGGAASSAGPSAQAPAHLPLRVPQPAEAAAHPPAAGSLMAPEENESSSDECEIVSVRRPKDPKRQRRRNAVKREPQTDGNDPVESPSPSPDPAPRRHRPRAARAKADNLRTVKAAPKSKAKPKARPTAQAKAALTPPPGVVSEVAKLTTFGREYSVEYWGGDFPGTFRIVKYHGYKAGSNNGKINFTAPGRTPAFRTYFASLIGRVREL